METMTKHKVAMAHVGVCSREIEAESPAAIAPPKQDERTPSLDFYGQLCITCEM